MCKESSYVFMLRDGADSLEVQYNEQSEGVYLAEAQIFVGGEHINGGCYFDIDNVEDMDRFISYLNELRERIKKHNEANPDSLHVVNSQYTKHELAPVLKCQSCGIGLALHSDTEQANGLCFDCEKKQIIQAADSFKPVVCMKCEGQFDNLLKKKLGICGKCMIHQAKAEKRNVGEYLTTMEYEEKIKHEHEAKIKMCKHIECDNEAAPGFTKCKLHLNSHIKHVDNVIPCEDLISVTCLVNNCKKISIGATGYCNDHIADYAPIRRNIKPTDITKPGC